MKTITKLVFVLSMVSMVVLAVANNSAKPDGTRLACNGNDPRCNEEKITPDGTRLACDGNSGCNVDEVTPFETSAKI